MLDKGLSRPPACISSGRNTTHTSEHSHVPSRSHRMTMSSHLFHPVKDEKLPILLCLSVYFFIPLLQASREKTPGIRRNRKTHCNLYTPQNMGSYVASSTPPFRVTFFAELFYGDRCVFFL
eukprot:RCo041922